MSGVVLPSARETFTPREITAAYKPFEARGAQYLDAETGIRASTYQFGEHMLLIYEESETGLVAAYSPECVEGVSLLNKSLSDRPTDRNGIEMRAKHGLNAAEAGR